MINLKRKIQPPCWQGSTRRGNSLSVDVSAHPRRELYLLEGERIGTPYISHSSLSNPKESTNIDVGNKPKYQIVDAKSSPGVSVVLP